MKEAPDIINSTEQERRDYIKQRFPCVADCDMCGLCKVFHGKDAETAYDDYISGVRTFLMYQRITKDDYCKQQISIIILPALSGLFYYMLLLLRIPEHTLWMEWNFREVGGWFLRGKEVVAFFATASD